jgi:hypothetical protein
LFITAAVSAALFSFCIYSPARAFY